MMRYVAMRLLTLIMNADLIVMMSLEKLWLASLVRDRVGRPDPADYWLVQCATYVHVVIAMYSIHWLYSPQWCHAGFSSYGLWHV